MRRIPAPFLWVTLALSACSDPAPSAVDAALARDTGNDVAARDSGNDAGNDSGSVALDVALDTGNRTDAAALDAGSDTGNDVAVLDTGSDTGGDTSNDVAALDAGSLDVGNVDSAMSADGGGTDVGNVAMHNDATGLVVPDFSLPDLNPNSPTTGRNVSPRAYLNQVSVWYFASAT